MLLGFIAQKATRVCTLGLVSSLMALGVVGTSHNAYAEETFHTPTKQLARKLVTRFWTAVKHQHVNAYSNLLAPQFQGMNISGSFTRNQQISSLKTIRMTHFKISQLVASRHKDTLVVTYNFTAKGKNITSGPSMDIWQRQGSHWKQVSHTYVPYP